MNELLIERVPLVALVRRDPTHDRALIVYCTRRPTDDDLRAIRDAVRNAEIIDAVPPGQVTP